MKSYIQIINGVYPDGVVYVRRSGKVIAARVESYQWCPSSFNCNDTYINIYRADGERERIYMRTEMSFYETIEDAINDNKIDVCLYDIESIVESFGFCYRKQYGANALGKMFYKWDGFKAIPVHLWSCYTTLTWGNQGWCFSLRDHELIAKKLYDTAEYCRKDNPVDVITF